MSEQLKTKEFKIGSKNAILIYDTKNKIIRQEGIDKSATAKSESIMSIGNGYMGIRANDPEIQEYNKEDFFVNGLFNRENADEVPELVNLANTQSFKTFIESSEFMIVSKDRYEKQIDLNNGMLTRIVESERFNNHYEIKTERFVSQANKHIYCQRTTIRQKTGTKVTVTLNPMIDGQVSNRGAQHCKEGIKRRTSTESVQYIEETTDPNNLVAHNLVTRVLLNGKQIKGGHDDYVITMSRRRVGFKIKVEMGRGDELVLEQLSSVNTSADESEPIPFANVYIEAEALYEHLIKTTFDKEKEKSDAEWKNIWGEWAIDIEGDSEDARYDRLALWFSIYHMNSFVPKSNPNLSTGAKGLSGEGYQGHTFWDTETFLLPNYLFTNPAIARNLLEYRYRGIAGARAKALEKKVRKEESNLNGAQYPWEMANPTMGEVCPYWGQADVITGHQEPIASRRQEIHVSADVAYAIDQYYSFTKDDKFMEDMGWEMILDTAVFWANRAEREMDGTYTINDVMGPNEYKGNINNNAYTNMMAKHNIDLALKFVNECKKTANGRKLLDKVEDNLPYSIPYILLEDVSAKLKQQLPNAEGIIAENDQFLGLQRVDVSPFQMLGDAGKKLFATKEGHIRLGSQLVKQADVVLLTHMLPKKFNKDIIKKNFDFYEPVTTHDSSLSPTTYAIQACDLKMLDKAYELFEYLIDIDLGANMHSCDEGIHAGALASIWQTIVFGFGGLRWIDGEIHFNPILPKAWDGLRYRIQFQGILIEARIKHDSFELNTVNNKKAIVYVQGEKTEITDKPKKFEVKYD